MCHISPFLPRVINGSVVAPSYELFLNNARSTTARNNDVIQRGLDWVRVCGVPEKDLHTFEVGNVELHTTVTGALHRNNA